MSAAKRLNNGQLEILKIFKYDLSDQQLKEIKNLLANYFADKASDEMDKLWEENNWDEETILNWSKEHMSTPYNPK